MIKLVPNKEGNIVFRIGKYNIFIENKQNDDIL